MPKTIDDILHRETLRLIKSQHSEDVQKSPYKPGQMVWVKTWNRARPPIDPSLTPRTYRRKLAQCIERGQYSEIIWARAVVVEVLAIGITASSLAVSNRIKRPVYRPFTHVRSESEMKEAE